MEIKNCRFEWEIARGAVKAQKGDVQAASRETKEGETSDIVEAKGREDEADYQAKQGHMYIHELVHL